LSQATAVKIPTIGDDMKKISEILEMMNDSKLNGNAEHVFRIKVDDLEQIIGLDLEGNVIYTRVEYKAQGNNKSSVKV
jgi:hypothetical protein